MAKKNNTKPSKAKPKSKTSDKAKSKGKAKPKSKKPSSKKGNTSGLLKPIFVFLFSLFILGVALWAALLDFELRSKFEGKRWSVPAKVYSRPLELYVGLEISTATLNAELKRLQYEQVENISRPATFVLSERGKDAFFNLRTKGFNFSDKVEVSQDVSLEIKDNILISMDQDLLRLEPQLIGGIHPGHNEDRVLVNLQQTPEFLIETLVLVEDKVYFEHFGISPKGILRAAFVNLFSGRVKQGGSTLTQQLVKNFYLSDERTFTRKINEAIMALLLESHYSKNEILETYLNEVHLGQLGKRAIHGFGLASEHYFGLPLKQLELHQVALMVAIVKGPSFYDPRRNSERALKRRNMVLGMLADNSFISAEDLAFYLAKPLDVTPNSSVYYKSYPAYLDLVKRQLKKDYSQEDLQSEGLRIFTSFDPILQLQSEQSLVETIEILKKSRDQNTQNLQSAMVVISPQTGEVQAIVGGTDVRLSGFNRALDAKRPIGSLVKPAIYLTALESRRYNWASLIDDNPVFVDRAGVIEENTSITEEDEKTWAPRNFDRVTHGENGLVPMIRAMSKSYNQASVRLGLDLGVDEVIKTLHRLGVEKKISPYPSVLLGAFDLSAYEVAQMYQTIAGGGFNTPLSTIREVQDANGVQLKSYAYTVEQVISEQQAYLIHAGLQEVVKTGTSRSLYRYLSSDLALAGKTGTTNNQRDSWFVGYSGNLLAAVWVGNDDNSETSFTGASGALKVWTHLAINTQLQAGNTLPPEDVVWEWIKPDVALAEQKLSAEKCEHALYIPLFVDTVPEVFSTCGQKYKKSGLRKLLGF